MEDDPIAQAAAQDPGDCAQRARSRLGELGSDVMLGRIIDALVACNAARRRPVYELASVPVVLVDATERSALAECAEAADVREEIESLPDAERDALAREVRAMITRISSEERAQREHERVDEDDRRRGAESGTSPTRSPLSGSGRRLRREPISEPAPRDTPAHRALRRRR